jgi:hypothetical protein
MKAHNGAAARERLPRQPVFPRALLDGLVCGRLEPFQPVAFQEIPQRTCGSEELALVVCDDPRGLVNTAQRQCSQPSAGCIIDRTSHLEAAGQS